MGAEMYNFLAFRKLISVTGVVLGDVSFKPLDGAMAQ